MNLERARATPMTSMLVALILVAFGLEFLGAPLYQWGANYGPLVWRGQVWRLLTSMFLHAGTLHLVVNLIAVVQLCRYYELMFGTRRFTILYFATGIIASLASASWNHTPSVGASGAIFGILGAMITSIRRSPRWRHDPVGRSIVTQGVFLVIVNLIITWTVPQIDKAGHVGGLIAGLILGWILPQPAAPPPPPAQVVIDVAPYDS